MPNLKISDMDPAAALTGDEQIEVSQAGATKRTTAQAIADLAAVGGALPSAYAQYLAAQLEPDALEAVQYGTFSYPVASGETKLLMASWQTRLGATGRMEQRNPERAFPMCGVTLSGMGADSCALILNPNTVTYPAPWTTYYDRLAVLYGLPTRHVTLTAASQKKPFLPGPYGTILTQVTCFNLAWVVTRFANIYGLNLMDEESDAAVQRVAGSLLLPFSKRVVSEVESSSASSSTGGSPFGSISFVQLPSTWPIVPDPISATYDFRDDFMGAALDTGVWTRAQSTVGNVEIDSTYQWLKFSGNTTWGANGLHRTTGMARSAGKAVVVDIYIPQGASATGVGMVGWSDGLGHSYTNFAHAVNFAGGVSPNGDINIYENGTLRGVVGEWTAGSIYRVRITLTATGATYEIQGGTEFPPIGSASWTDITPGTTSSATATLHPGGAAYGANGYISDFRVY